MKKKPEDQILLVPFSPELQLRLRSLANHWATDEITAFRAVNRPGQPLAFILAPRGLMGDVESLLGAYQSLVALYWRDR